VNGPLNRGRSATNVMNFINVTPVTKQTRNLYAQNLDTHRNEPHFLEPSIKSGERDEYIKKPTGANDFKKAATGRTNRETLRGAMIVQERGGKETWWCGCPCRGYNCRRGRPCGARSRCRRPPSAPAAPPP
jgi:hypothetical protein